MNIICEIFIEDFFKLSTGQIAIVGEVIPNIEKFIPAGKADLYIDNQKVKTINLIGEDRFSKLNINKQSYRRSVRTTDDISTELNTKGNKEAKLIIYQ